MAAAPNWLPAFTTTRSSIVYVKILPEDPEGIRQLAEIAQSMEWKEREEALRAGNSFNSMGLVIGFDPERVEFVILTTAHSIEHVYHGTRAPITAGMINRLFRIRVLCDHFENDIREAAGIGDRAYGPARAFAVNCQIDCLLLTVPASHLRRLNGQVCGEPHPVLNLNLAIQELGDCMLVSWPYLMPRTTCQGFIGQPRRIQDVSTNRAGYDMTVLQAQIGTSDAGSSGGPLVNLDGHVIGILHGPLGVMGGPFSLFIPAAHIRDFLFENGFHADEEEEDEEDEQDEEDEVDEED